MKTRRDRNPKNRDLTPDGPDFSDDPYSRFSPSNPATLYASAIVG